MKAETVILKIDNVRIRRLDDMNVILEREETAENYNPKLKKKTVNTNYRFKGYYGSVLGALQAISVKGLLVDENSCAELNDHLKQVEESNQKIIDAVEGLKIND